ncbi:hypothetical protein N7467_011303 [Penicillium canescens]|nr:hypothetical protein N7467_011303 [Penicillium canescens]
MTLTGIVQNYSGLLAARFFLGVTEAGLFPGLAFYVSLWYPRKNSQFRLALIFASASMTGAFSGLLAYLISKMDGVGGLEGWRWIFILEGLLTVVVAVFSFFLVWDEPATAAFLSEHEKRILLDALNYTQTETSTAPQLGNKHSFKWKHFVDALLDWQTWFHCLGYWGMACSVYALSLFLPTIIKGLGYSAALAQLLTIPVYAAATISCILVGFYSDRTGQRSFFTFACYTAVFVGFLIAVAPARFIPGLTYAGCFIAACGMYPAIPGLLTLSSNNWAPDAKRALNHPHHRKVTTETKKSSSWYDRASIKVRRQYHVPLSPHLLILPFEHLIALKYLVLELIAVHRLFLCVREVFYSSAPRHTSATPHRPSYSTGALLIAESLHSPPFKSTVMFATKRLGKELLKMKDHVPPGIEIVKSDTLEEWQMDIKVLDDNPLYFNQTYRLKFTFNNKYPIEPPEVQFIQCDASTGTPRTIPMHPHIYSNGIICLDLLGTAGWSPVQTVESVCMSLQSMLTANNRDERPPGDQEFITHNRRRIRDINFVYEDDNV